ncbi:MAG: hypothetical protein WBG76_02180, partial [Ornithinimicrobium sp.]
MAQVGMRSGSEQREPADVVMTGGAIRTMNEAQPQVEAVAIRGGRIVAAGSRANVEGLQGPGTE